MYKNDKVIRRYSEPFKLKILDELKKEGKDIKDQITEDFKEVKEDVSKAAKSGKEKFNEDFKDFRSKASYKTEQAITFLEKQLAALKEKNKTYQHTS